MSDPNPLRSVDPSFSGVSLVLAATHHPLDLATAAWLHAKAARTGSAKTSTARAMEDTGAKVSDIQARLGHDSLATTGRYLAALHRADNPHADHLAALFGLDQ